VTPKPLLAPAHLAELARFAADRTLVALDFDGTLAPIVARPGDARMRARTALLLARVARRYPVVVVSGRARRDAARRVRPAAVEVIGSHGAETRDPPRGLRAVIARARRRLAPAVRRLPGAWLEDKVYSLALHYRAARRPARVRRALAAAAAAVPGVALVPGKRVLNVVGRRAPDKGAAVAAACRARGCGAVIFVGDDETDENVFRAPRPARRLGVRIGRTRRTQAGYYLRDQGEVDAFLEALVRLRPAAVESTMTRDERAPVLGRTLDFMRLLWGLDHALQRRSKRMATHHGVTGPQRLALRIIGRAPQVSAGELAATLEIHPSTLTGVLQRLERRGLVTRRRDRGDRRRQRLELTARGRRIIQSSAGSVEQAVARVLQRTAAADLAATARVLTALVDHLEAGER